MGTRKSCEEYRAALVDHRGGGRDAPDQAAFEAHRAACPSCAEEARRDEWLVKALSSMPEDAPPPTTWAQVLAGQQSVTTQPRFRAQN